MIPAVPPMIHFERSALSHVPSYMFQNNGWKPSPLHQQKLSSVCPRKSIHFNGYCCDRTIRSSLYALTLKLLLLFIGFKFRFIIMQ